MQSDPASTKVLQKNLPEKGILVDPAVRPDTAFAQPQSHFYSRHWARSSIAGFDPVAFIDVFVPEIEPHLVMGSVLYEKNLGKISSPRIICSGITTETKQAYIIREYPSNSTARIAPDETSAYNFIRRITDTLNLVNERNYSGLGDRGAAHGFLCPGQIIYTENGEHLINGLNLHYLHYLSARDPKTSELLESDPQVNRYRVCRTRSSQTLRAERDVESILLMVLETIPGGEQDLDTLYSQNEETRYIASLKKCISRYPVRAIRETLSRGLVLRELKTPLELFEACSPVFQDRQLVVTAKSNQPALDRLNSCTNIDSDTLQLLMEKTPYLKGEHRKPLLIVGPTGTGKTRIARAIHEVLYGSREFYRVNCGSLPDDDKMLSEIFGHTADAFTGANKERKGRLAQCVCGTVFLDDIQNLSLAGQARLLQLFDSGYTFSPLGSDKTLTCTATLMLAANIEPSVLIRTGRLFEDFFFRISNFMVVQLKPLTGDKPGIGCALENAWDVVRQMYPCARLNTAPGLRSGYPEVWKALLDAPYPGNYRTVNYYAQEAWFSLRANSQRTGRAELTAGDARRIVAGHMKLVGESSIICNKNKVDLARDGRDLLEYLCTAEDKYNRKKAAEAIGHVRDDGTGLVSRINELIRQINDEKRKTLASRRGGFCADEWSVLVEFSRERKKKKDTV